MKTNHDFMEWDNQLTLGIPLIDRQHKRLLQLTNNLYLTYLQNNETTKPDLIESAREIVDYLRYHFTNEEKLMFLFDFPDYSEHKREHESSITEIMSHIQKFSSGSYLVPYRFVRFFREWIFSHIDMFDRKVAKFVLSIEYHDKLEQFFPTLA